MCCGSSRFPGGIAFQQAVNPCASIRPLNMVDCQNRDSLGSSMGRPETASPSSPPHDHGKVASNILAYQLLTFSLNEPMNKSAPEGETSGFAKLSEFIRRRVVRLSESGTSSLFPVDIDEFLAAGVVTMIRSRRYTRDGFWFRNKCRNKRADRNGERSVDSSSCRFPMRQGILQRPASCRCDTASPWNSGTKQRVQSAPVITWSCTAASNVEASTSASGESRNRL